MKNLTNGWRFIVTLTLVLTLGLALASGGEAKAAGASAMSDQEFFGVYNGSTWTQVGALDYDLASLSTVKTKVMAGDYEGAKAALLAHYRQREDYWDFFDQPRRSKACEAFLNEIFTLGYSESYIGSLFLSYEWGTRQVDLTNEISQYDIDDNRLSFILMAKNKGEGEGEIKSRESGQGAKLQITLKSGEVKTIFADKDTYIYGLLDGFNYGTKDQLLIKDNGDPYYKNLKKGYMSFPLPDLDVEQINQVLLIVEGRHHNNGTKEIMVYKTGEDGWDEYGLDYKGHQGRTFSYNMEGGCTWKLPSSSRGADNEYQWQIPRFYYARDLSFEYELTGEERFASGLINIMLDFIGDKDSNGKGLGGFPRSIDAANRVDNWSFAYPRIIKSPSMTPTAHADILKSVYKVAKFLNGDYGGNDYYHADGNWGIIETETLIRTSVMFPEFKASKQWSQTCSQRYKELSNIVINEDGAYRESTTGYANGVALSYIKFLEMLQKAGTEPDPDFLANLEKLCTYMSDVVYPNGKSVIWGDSSAYDAFKDLTFMGTILDNQELLYIGSGGTEGQEPVRRSVEYPSNNIAILRSGWQKEDSYVFFHASPGTMHKHYDDNSLMFYSQGSPLLVDTGTFTYATDTASNWLKRSTVSHNTIEVDGQRQPREGHERKAFNTNPYVDYVSYAANSTGNVKHTRSLLFIKPNLLLVNDYMEPSNSSNHTYRMNWHMAPQLQPSIEENGKTFAGTPENQGETGVRIISATNGLTTSIEDGYYTEAFYSVKDSKYTRYTKSQSGQTIFNTLLLPTNSNETSNVTYEEIPINQGTGATATKLSMGSVEGIYYQRYNSQYNLTNVDSFKIDARVAYIEKESNGPKQIFMKNGKAIEKDNTTWVESRNRLPEFQATYEETSLKIFGTGLVPDSTTATAIKIYAPQGITTVRLNDEEITFTREGDYIYAAGVAVSTNETRGVIADGFVRDGNYANEVRGGWSILTLKKCGTSYTRHPHLKFDLSGIDANALTKVEYSFYVRDLGSPLLAKVFEVDPAAINEETLTWNNKPEVGLELGSVNITEAGKWYTVDITDLVYEKETLDQIGLVMQSFTEENAWASISSRESENPAYVTLTYGAERIKVVKDAYVNDGKEANDAHGGYGYLTIRNGLTDYNRKAFMKFDTSTLTTPVEEAILRLKTARKGPTDMVVNIYKGAVDDFDESTMTWNNQVAKGDLVTSVTFTGAQQWYEVDLTTFINNNLEKDSVVFIFEAADAMSEWSSIYSREANLGAWIYFK